MAISKWLINNRKIAALEADLASTLELEAKLDSECYQSNETRQALMDFIESRRK